MNPVELIRGDSPIVLGLPHTGTYLPSEISANLNKVGKTLSDTDWHIHTLYDDLIEDVTTVRATFHRYVIDANRDPEGESLYPGQNTTGLVPLTDFDGKPIWSHPPTDDEIKQRLVDYHTPYHEALEQELQRVRDKHGVAILYDCHSIRSHIPFLFEGTLPDFNIGTNEGQTCDKQLQDMVWQICQQATDYTSVLNGRFKGGWTTRHNGRPAENIHAVQMELAQSTHLKSETLPFEYDMAKAAHLRKHLQNILTSLANLAPKLGANS